MSCFCPVVLHLEPQGHKQIKAKLIGLGREIMNERLNLYIISHFMMIPSKNTWQKKGSYRMSVGVCTRCCD